MADKDIVLRDLEPLMAAFWNAAAGGARDSFDYDADRLHILRKTSRRNNTRDHIVDRLRAEIGSRPDVVVRDDNQTTIFGLFGRYEIKVKKADECGDVELAKTQVSMDFQCQKQPSFFGDEFAPLVNLYLSYVDTSDPREPTVHLICPKDGGMHWMEEIARPAGDGTIEITPRPLPPEDDGDLVRVIPIKITDEAE